MKHPPLVKCDKNDAQCDELNRRLQQRQLAVSGERYVNNILIHFVVGFIVIYTLLSFKIKWSLTVFSSLGLGLGLVAGWVLADVCSYLIHIVIDSPYWMQNITKIETGSGFTVVDGHHDLPLNYSLLNNVELICLSYPAFVPLLLLLSVAHFFYNPLLLTRYPLYLGFFVSFVGFTLLGAYCHKWAHERTHNLLDNKFICLLQDWHILLNNESHKKHHAVKNDRERYSFSLTNGSAEIVLDPLLRLCRTRDICTAV